MTTFALYPYSISVGANPSNTIDLEIQMPDANWRSIYDPGADMMLWPDPSQAAPNPWPEIGSAWTWNGSQFIAPPPPPPPPPKP
jgi:hypothetical protein